jgi:uncharacterized protein YhbP (UPF0306 family)
MTTNLTELAKSIIEQNEYISLATVGEGNEPWVSMVAYAYDDKLNFYFLSLPSSNHIKNAQKHKKVAFSIYDSRQNFGYGVGLQIEGTLEEVPLTSYPSVGKIYLGRKYPYGNVNNTFMEGIKQLLKNKIYKFYKLTPTTFWINDPDKEIDERVKLDLI